MPVKYRADQVGSFLRPKELIEARRADPPDPERLRAIESFDLNIDALQDANVAGHAVSAVDAGTWQ